MKNRILQLAAAPLVELEQMEATESPCVIEGQIQHRIALVEETLQLTMGNMAMKEQRCNPHLAKSFAAVQAAKQPDGLYKLSPAFSKAKMQVAWELWNTPVYREVLEPLLSCRSQLKDKLLQLKKMQKNYRNN